MDLDTFFLQELNISLMTLETQGEAYGLLFTNYKACLFTFYYIIAPL